MFVLFFGRRGDKMVQIIEQDIKNQTQDILLNYLKRVIRMTTDYQIVTIGNLQIENLDWRWKPEVSTQINTHLMYALGDHRCPSIWGNKGKFAVTKYGLSYRQTPLTLASHKPLWNPGTDKEEQARIMWQESKRMEKYGTKKCKDGIEIIPDTQMWHAVDSLSKKARDVFRKSLIEKVQDLEAKKIPYDSEKLWDAGVPVPAELLDVLRNLKQSLTTR